MVVEGKIQKVFSHYHLTGNLYILVFTILTSVTYVIHLFLEVSS